MQQTALKASLECLPVELGTSVIVSKDKIAEDVDSKTDVVVSEVSAVELRMSMMALVVFMNCLGDLEFQYHCNCICRQCKKLFLSLLMLLKNKLR
jgi:hypothetical protein